MIEGKVPIPTNGINKPSRASDGIVCKILVICRTISAARLYWTNQIASETAITVAINNEINEICKCWRIAVHKSERCV